MIFQRFRSAVTFATHLPRYREILNILFKYGFADVLKLVALEHLLGFENLTIATHEMGILAKPLAVRTRLALEELGPTFIKFGQILSSRRDLIDDEFYEELCKLQDHVPPFPTKQVYQIINESLGAPVEKIFKSFEEEPCGSASIAQVHEAVLRDGTHVAVKVQRPDITEVINQDLAILADLASFLENHVPEIESLSPQKVIEEFSETLKRELNFIHEAMNSERFAKQFEGNHAISIPAIYREASSDRVLTMQFMKGIRIDDRKNLLKHHITPEKLAVTVTDLIYQQIFKYGFFHADPHPGNMIVLSGGVIGLYDYGMMGTFSLQFRRSIAGLITGLAKRNHRQVMRAILDMSEEGSVDDSVHFLSQVEEFSNENLAESLRDIKLGEVLNKLLAMLRENKLRMKGNFYLGIKALTQVEAIGRHLDPTLNFIVLGKPYAMELISERYQPQRILKIGMRMLTETIDFLDDLPHDLQLLYTKLKRGQISLPLEHRIAPEGIEPLRQTLDSVFNRLVNALLASSLLIASSILIHSRIPPHLFGIPVFGLVGFLLGFYLCLRLAISIWRHGGL
ncbi:MAG: AarF/ABC1/UbiB kinase family protein [Verrucomicrobia bacterium]|nr:AarF/ABC1/UbiB kinase family protein [Verrucomicrobiota bacterium]